MRSMSHEPHVTDVFNVIVYTTFLYTEMTRADCCFLNTLKSNIVYQRALYNNVKFTHDET